MNRLVKNYLQWRLKGCYTFKPPIGWRKGVDHPPLLKRMAYHIKKAVWRLEMALMRTQAGKQHQREWDERMRFNPENWVGLRLRRVK